MCHSRQSCSLTPLSTFLRGRTLLRLWSRYQQEKTRRKLNNYHKMATTMMAMRRKRMRKKKKRATKLKLKMMRSTLL
jgi:hypothetical protein